jgi:hypothetical protein
MFSGVHGDEVSGRATPGSARRPAISAAREFRKSSRRDPVPLWTLVRQVRLAMSARLLVAMTAQTLWWSAALAEVPTYDTSGRFAGTYLCGATAAADLTWDAVKGQWHGEVVGVRDGSLSLKVSSPEFRSWKAFGIDLSAAFYTASVARLSDDSADTCFGGRDEYLPDDSSLHDNILVSPDGFLWCGSRGGSSHYYFDLTGLKYVEVQPGDVGTTSGHPPTMLAGTCQHMD